MGSDYDIAIDAHGRPLAMGPADVRATIDKMMVDGKLLALVVEKQNEIGVVVLGPPSQALADALDTAAQGYRAALKGH